MAISDPSPRPSENPADPAVASATGALLDIMARLRGPGGCPWDREQTHDSILSCLVEEAYEFIDAVENRDPANMREELGDVLLQVVFHAQMAKEAGLFDFADVARTLSEKLVRRHPHVFGEARVEGAAGVQRQWDEVKRQEKAGAEPGAAPEGALAGVPKHLPALLKAEKLQKKAAKVGFDWPDARGALAKVREELGEVEAELPGGDAARLEDEVGDLLFAAVNVARSLKVDPEVALGKANTKFRGRFEAMEGEARARGESLDALAPERLDELWERAKRSTGGGP